MVGKYVLQSVFSYRQIKATFLYILRYDANMSNECLNWVLEIRHNVARPMVKHILAIAKFDDKYH